MNKKKNIFILVMTFLIFQNNHGMFRRLVNHTRTFKRLCIKGMRHYASKLPSNTKQPSQFATRAELEQVNKKIATLNRAVAQFAVNQEIPWQQVRAAFSSELGALKNAVQSLNIRLIKQEQTMKDLEFFLGDLFDHIEDKFSPKLRSKPLIPGLLTPDKSKKFNNVMINELVQKVDQLIPSNEAKKHIIDEINRLHDDELHASEKSEVKAYISYILRMPWQKFTADQKDIKKAHAILDEDHYGMHTVKDHILDEIAVKNLKEEGTMPIMCLVGQPGTGKTSIGKSIARALGRKYVRVALGGVGDESELRGHRRTYIGSRPGRIVQAIKNCGVSNPVMLFDEIDKVSLHGRGNISAALLEVLDPEQNRYFVDRYLEVPFDLSQVLFVVTANDWNNIAKPLQDRLEKIQIPGYTIDAKVKIAHNYLWPKQLKSAGLKDKQIVLNESIIKYIIIHYADEPGVRQLDRCLRKLARKAVRSLQENGSLPEFNQETIVTYFGKSKVDDMHKHIL